MHIYTLIFPKYKFLKYHRNQRKERFFFLTISFFFNVKILHKQFICFGFLSC